MLVDTVMDFAIFYKLRGAEALDRDIRLTAYEKLNPEEYQSLDSQVRNRIANNLGSYTESIISTAGSHWAHPWVDDQLLQDQRINLRFYEGIENHVDIISGNFPSGAIYQDGVVKGVISENLADDYDLETGDQLPLSYQTSETEASFHIEISGIVRPKNSRASYWFGEFNPLFRKSDKRWTSLHNIIIPQETFFKVTNELYPESRAELNWHILTSIESIRPEDGPIIRNNLENLKTELSELDQKYVVETKLNDLLASFIVQAEVVRAPLYLLVVEVLFLALYYVTMLAVLSVRQVEGEFATLSSRGASSNQIFKIQATEAGLIGIVAILSGPVLASLLVWSLAKFGPLADVRQANWVTQLPQAAWVAAVIGGLACILGLLSPLRQSIGRSVVIHQRSVGRQEKPPWWHRYYIDVFLALIGLVLLWRLNIYGGVVAGSGTHGRVDWLLLLSPLILLIGAATILLRVFPLILRGLSKQVSKGRGISLSLALWHTSRNPTHVARLVLLLTLAMALGILSTGLNATLDLSAFERALYAAGSDLRLVFDRPQDLSTITDTPGVKNTSTVWRGDGMVNVRTHQSFPTFNMIAIEPVSFSQVTRYRQDYADTPMGEALGKLLTDPDNYPVSMIPLPGKPTEIGVWIYDSKLENIHARPLDYLNLKAKIQTSHGEVLTVDLLPSEYTATKPVSIDEGLLPPEWTTLFLPLLSLDGQTTPIPVWKYSAAELPHLKDDSYPLSLHSLWFKVRPLAGSNNWQRQTRQFLFILDDLTVVGSPEGKATIVEDFEGGISIWQTNDTDALAQFNKRGTVDHSGDASLYIFIPANQKPSGLSVSPARALEQKPLPVLASQGFLETTELEIGDELIGSVAGVETSFEIKDVVHYFPTMFDEGSQGFLITALEPWLVLLNQNTSQPVNYNEMWVTTENPLEASALAESFPTASQSSEMDTIRRIIKADPLSLGLRSVTYLGYILTVVLSLVGFVTYFYMSARQRGTTYSVLRSMGLSRRQLYGSLVLEQIILISIGLTLGTLLGLLLNKMILPGVPISLGDRPPIPPFIPQENWEAVRRLYISLTAAFLITLGAATALLWRSRIHRVLRIGQE
jgi:ABC-type lipoprotein release transport system permease subunit